MPLDIYCLLALPRHIYDFKITNGTKGVKEGINPYRGMPILAAKDITMYASARDIGNIAAGIIAGNHGIDYPTARKAFDFLQSCQSKTKAVESESTQAAQQLGYLIGRYYGSFNTWRYSLEF